MSASTSFLSTVYRVEATLAAQSDVRKLGGMDKRINEVPHTSAAKDQATRPGAQERADAIFATLRHRICTARFPPGMVLHEASLAEEFGVSRSPIRRVFARLEQANLLEIRHGVGARVTEIEMDQLVDAYRIRMMLAAASGPHFRQPFPDGTVKFFDDCIKRFRDVELGDTTGFGDANAHFFTEFCSLIESPTLCRLHEQLFFETSRMWLLRLPELDWQETVEGICREVADLKWYAEMNDPEGLAFSMRTSLREALQRFGASASDRL